MQTQVGEAPPAPPAPAQPPIPDPVATTPAPVAGMPAPTAAQILQAAEAKREVLGEQLSRLLNRRGDVQSQLRSAELSAPERAALEQHYTELSARIVDVEKQIAGADAAWANAAGTPGSTLQEPRGSNRNDGPPEEMFIIGSVFVGISAMIMAIAYARRLWKGTTSVVAQIPAAFEHRFARMEQSLDAVAIEVERVSEGQRFLTKVFADQSGRAVGAGAAQPVESRAGVGEPARRA